MVASGKGLVGKGHEENPPDRMEFLNPDRVIVTRLCIFVKIYQTSTLKRPAFTEKITSQ